MALTHEERAELHRIEKAARALRSKKNAEASERIRKEAKARRKAHKATTGQRAPRQRDNAYLAWLRRLPCVACGSREHVEAAHIRAGYPSAGWRPTGMQEKPDDTRCAPLCASCHREGPDAQHRSNERTWWSARGIDPPDLCRALRKAYDANEDGSQVIRRFIPTRRP